MWIWKSVLEGLVASEDSVWLAVRDTTRPRRGDVSKRSCCHKNESLESISQGVLWCIRTVVNHSFDFLCLDHCA